MTPARRPARVAVAVVALLSLLGLTMLPATSAGAHPAASTDTTLQLQSQSAWVAPTGTFRIRIHVPVAIGPGAKLTARLYTKVSTEAQLERTGRGESLSSLQSAPVTVPLDTAPVVGGDLDLSFPVVVGGTTPPYGFQISREGVYPLALRILDADGGEIGSLYTHLVRLPAADASSGKTPLTVALVLPVGAPVAHQPDGSVDIDADQQAALAQLINTIGQTPGVPLTLTPTPETVSALSEGDLSNNTKVVTSLATASRGRQVVTGPWVALDSGAWVGQGLTDAFGRELALGTSTLKDLLGFDPDISTATVDATTTADVLSALAPTGATQAVVPSGRLEPTSKSTSATNPALTQTFDLMSGDGGRLRAVATDDAMTDRLASDGDRVLAAHEVVASLSLLALSPASGGCVLAPDADQCSRGLALQLPGSAADAQTPLSVLLEAFADRTGTGSAGVGDAQPIISPMTVDNLVKVVDPASESGRTGSGVTVQRRTLTSVNSPSLGNYPTALRGTQGRVDGFRSMVAISDTGAPTSAAPAVTGGLDLAASLDQVTASSGLDRVRRADAP